MPIRWSALKVSQSLDEMERLLNQAEPMLNQLSAKASETSHLPNLAGYISEPLAVFAYEVKDRLEKYRHRIKTIRGYIPQRDLAKEQKAFDQWLNLFDGDREKAEVAMNIDRPEPKSEPKEQLAMGWITSKAEAEVVNDEDMSDEEIEVDDMEEV